MVSRSLVFAAAITAPSSLSGWSTHAFSSPFNHRAAVSRPNFSGVPRVDSSRDVSLQMGIRSFIKRKILRRDEGGDDMNDSKKETPEDIDLRTVLQSPNSSGLMEGPVTSYTSDEGEDERKSSRKDRQRNKAVDDILTKDMKQRLQEDARHRIQRVQAGGMTEEEKLSFLNAALTRTSPPKKPRGPPIRQKIPGMEDDESASGTAAKNESAASKREGSKKDNLWSAISGKGAAGSSSSGGKSDYVPVSSLILDGKLRNEEAKRQWIDSITSPDRFSSFSSIQRDASQATESFVEETTNEAASDSSDSAAISEVVSDQSEDDTAVETNLGEQDFTQIKRQMMEDQEILLKKPKVEKPGEKSVREALESILAMTGNKSASSSNTTESKNNNDLAARLEKAALEQETRDAENRIAVEKKRMEEKQALIEAQREREAKFMRQEAERMEEARKKAEQMRLDAEAKKAAEQAKVDAAIAKQEEYWAKQLQKQQAKREASMSVQERREMEQRKLNEARETEEMFERDIAKDVKRDQIREEERMREPQHEGEILQEAAEGKLRDRELTRVIIDQSAAKVSRTVVKPSKGDASISAFVQEQRKKKEEIDRLAEVQQQRLKMLNSPLTPTKKPPVRMTVPGPTPVPAKPPAPRPAPVVSSNSPELSLSSLTMKKSAPSQGSQINPSTVKRPVKKAVRQQLPISSQVDDEDDEEDDDNLMKKGASGLTVADALQQQKREGGSGKSTGGKKMDANDRAKQWGIDMSKFN